MRINDDYINLDNVDMIHIANTGISFRRNFDRQYGSSVVVYKVKEGTINGGEPFLTRAEFERLKNILNERSL
ncbi:unnamed protein product [marine sediment metagenome]|uniref:Uncharacterized protein n=1 Tax=marine sediment metagenome TaxID=412755 RepID=X1DTF0_9ZZZZ